MTRIRAFFGAAQSRVVSIALAIAAFASMTVGRVLKRDIDSILGGFERSAARLTKIVDRERANRLASYERSRALNEALTAERAYVDGSFRTEDRAMRVRARVQNLIA